MLVSKFYFIAFLVQAFAKESQSNPPTKRKSAFIKLTNLQCQCLNETFCKFEQCRLKAVQRNVAQLFLNLSLLQRPITNCKINIDLYRKYTVYNSFPFNVTVDACRFMENTSKNPILHNVYQMLANSSSFNHTCPYFEENIVIQNLTATYTSYFAFVPSGSYMIKSRWINNDVPRVLVNVWYEVQNPENTFFREGL